MFGNRKRAVSGDGSFSKKGTQARDSMPSVGDTELVDEVRAESMARKPASDMVGERIESSTDSQSDQNIRSENEQEVPKSAGKGTGSSHWFGMLITGLVLIALGIVGLWFGVWLFEKTRGVKLLFTSVSVGRIARYYWAALSAGAVLLIPGLFLLRSALRIWSPGLAGRKKIRKPERGQTKEERGQGKMTGEGQEPIVPENIMSMESLTEFCPQCGRPVTQGAKFCGGCGARLG